MLCTIISTPMGLFYCQFYCNSDSSTLLHLYTPPIHPHLEYFPVWSPISHYSTFLDKVSLFAAKICCKDWSSNFLSKHCLPSLSLHIIATHCISCKISNSRHSPRHAISLPSTVHLSGAQKRREGTISSRVGEGRHFWCDRRIKLLSWVSLQRLATVYALLTYPDQNI